MSLSCTCYVDEDSEPGSWYYYPPDDFIKFSEKRRKRCCSCKELINLGSDCLEFARCRSPYTEIEEKISGDEIVISSWFMCDKCSEQYLNLTDIGYCVDLEDNMLELLKEYQELTGFNKG